MNFFWKVFFSTIIIAAVTFSVGSFSLIDSQFRTALDREVTAVYKENDILCYSLNQEMQTANNNKYSSQPFLRKAVQKQMIGQIAQSVTVNTSKGPVHFRLDDSNYKTIFTGSNIDIDNSILRQLTAHKKGYEIINSGSHYYIHAAGPLSVNNETFYLENFRDITFLFANRSEQYKTFTYLMFAMIAASIIVVFIVSHWLTSPLKKLSQATRQIAYGHFDQRVNIQSRDEIGKLAVGFNTMAIRLEQMMEELKEASRRQEDFVASFAHELKTPLTSMIGYADMLRSKKMEPEQTILSANYIFEEGKRLESLSMKLMDMMVLKNQEFSLKNIRVADFFAAVQGLMLPVLAGENIELTVDAEDAIVKIEPDLMKTVCINLLDNARKAIDNGGHITFLGKWKSDRYLFMVQDTGKGIEATELSKITEAFYMIDKSRSRAQGSAGLGLAISSEILKLHGAAMEFQSSPGKGTCVTIWLEGAERI